MSLWEWLVWALMSIGNIVIALRTLRRQDENRATLHQAEIRLAEARGTAETSALFCKQGRLTELAAFRERGGPRPKPHGGRP